MKRLFIGITLNLYALSLFAQDNPYASGWAGLDYTVPQSPAFSILGTNPSNIIEPTSLKSAVFNIGNYLVTNGSVIPKNLSAEVNPLLLNSNLSLQQYQRAPILYRWALSLGTNANSNGTYNIAEGLRITLLDKTDARTDKDYLNDLGKIAAKYAGDFAKATQQYAKLHNMKVPEVQDKINTPGNDSSVYREVSQLASVMNNGDAVDQDIMKRRSDFKGNSWNKTIIQIGVAMMEGSKDSLAKDISSITKYEFWGSGTVRLGNNGEALIGIKYQQQDSIGLGWIDNGSAAVRFYYGQNNLKAYLQGQLNWINTIPSQTYTFGCEYNVSNGIWVEFAVNAVSQQKGNFVIKPTFNLNFGTPEKKSKT